ncbi:putative serine/threonine protein kinase [Saccharomycopsis crataegensis]|uniref:non-specific serine/threonine protein kinase n=1 Tax=Saccharomycopsis crataegensis TaxID=43959 RepID=A0AAV5QHQ7_9ASCO|nr:putative serine/threonine protein kinase [Saccharomycopsis crataegensis]
MELLAACFPCLPVPRAPVLRINGGSFRIIKLLGEGGFSYVYLVESSDGNRYALKKIRCAYGAESIKNAMNEVAAYKEFNSPYIIKSVDTSIVEEKDGSKSIYILLPYYEHGTLQDLLTDNIIKGNHINENEAIRLFIGICRGLQVMHRHKLSYAQNSSTTNDIDMEIQRMTRDSHDITPSNKKKGLDDINRALESRESDVLLLDSDEEDDDQEIDTDADTLMGSTTAQNVAHALNEGGSLTGNDNLFLETTEMGETVPYAHRDLKPANVMLSVDGIPVLCDLGSTAKAHIHIKNRQQALSLQDLAAEHCTLPYRAPELLDVSTGAFIDERIDIWSLGCTLYALLYGSSPFERAEAESGASVSLAISSGKYEFPRDDVYSDNIKDLIKFCLVLDPSKRPTIEQVLSKALTLSQ